MKLRFLQEKPQYYYSKRFYDDEDCEDDGGEESNSNTGNSSNSNPCRARRSQRYEYRYVVPLDQDFSARYHALKKPNNSMHNYGLLTEQECNVLGIVQSVGWQHVAFFDGFKTLVFRRPVSE